uniref:Pancreatic trypsin inhibitor n=1 Tax=Rhipicephalus zambeziensis TaxID=60191 RepID=A0A224YB34_9ACAR
MVNYKVHEKMTPLYALRVLAVLKALSWCYVAQAVRIDPRCRVPPQIERCSSLLLQWSFIRGDGRCEQGFVCHESPNSFQTRAECETLCPAVPKGRPPARTRSCRYWLLHMDRCTEHWEASRRDIFGRVHDYMVFTGCGYWKRVVYVYSLRTKSCRIKPWWWRLPRAKKIRIADAFVPALVLPVTETFSSIPVPDVHFGRTMPHGWID